MRIYIFAALVLFAGPALADPTLPPTDIIAGAVDGYVRPHMQAFAADSATLANDLAALCATPTPAAATLVRDDFKTVVRDHAGIEFLYFGPLTLGDRSASLLFWPDNKGIGLKQVQQVLASKDADATDPATLAKKSVALRGLGALEFVLFGTGSEAIDNGSDAYRCAFGAAIAVQIKTLAATLAAEWLNDGPDGPRAHMLDPQPDAADYRTTKEVLEKLSGALLVGSETIRDQRISPILGTAEGKPRPKSALFWRSGMTVPALLANFEGLKALFLAARFPEAVKGNMWIASGATFEFDNAIEALAKLSGSMESIVADPAALQKLKYVLNVTRSLDTLVGENLSGALGLTIGFSGLDGD